MSGEQRAGVLPDADSLPLPVAGHPRRGPLRPAPRDLLEARHGAEARSQFAWMESSTADCPGFPHEEFRTLVLSAEPLTDHQTCAEPPSHAVSPLFFHSPAGETPARAGGARARAALGGEGRQSARSLAAGPRGVPNRGGDGADARHSARPRRQLRDETRRRVPEIEGFPGLAGSSSKKTAWSRWTSTRRSARRAFCRRGARRRRSARRWTSSTRPLWRARKSGTCSAWSGRRDTTSGPTGR